MIEFLVQPVIKHFIFQNCPVQFFISTVYLIIPLQWWFQSKSNNRKLIIQVNTGCCLPEPERCYLSCLRSDRCVQKHVFWFKKIRLPCCTANHSNNTVLSTVLRYWLLRILMLIFAVGIFYLLQFFSQLKAILISGWFF